MRAVSPLLISSLALLAPFVASAQPSLAPAAAAAKPTPQPTPSSFSGAGMPDVADPKFREKLQTMLSRTDKSIMILREQITQNQSAPFLANLYLQLGDLLSEKSNVLYYLQMEHDKNTDLKVKETKQFSPVVQAQQEAITVYKQILADFPKFDKTNEVLYRLANAQKSIDEGAAFADTAEKLIKAFPKSKEAMQAHLLLGQFFYDKQDYQRALQDLTVVRTSPEPFERNSAKYRIGLIDLAIEKQADALKEFEQVALDPELKDSDNPAEMNLKSKSVKSNLKREALTDSVRAYTEVYKNNPDPVAYYSRIAPTELLFQETIEKLAYRYIFLKQYNSAVKLLRTLSERTADPQKIMNIYHEVLLMIPLVDRIKIPVGEIQFVMEKFNEWSTHFALKPELRKKSLEFFETQLRELGTRSHDFAKKETDKVRKADLYARAREFYTLYLGFFHTGAQSVKVATNLADVYYNEANYLASGSYYLRVYEGEFGKSPERVSLIQNAILSLQKPSDYAFYEQLRAKGLLVKSILTYQELDPKKKRDPGLNFALAKTYYEQGLYDRALTALYDFMKQYPNASEVSNAAELILNYFNIRSDFKGLVEWSQKMLALNPRSADLQKRLKEVRSKALLRRLDEQVKSQKGYDVFSQGKSYLQAAMLSGNSGLRSAAFEQALARSKSEKDIETFLTTANLMAKSEKDAGKRSDLMNSMADETFAISRFYTTLATWRKLVDESSQSAASKAKAFDKMVKLALMMRDYPLLSKLLNERTASTLPAETRKSALHAVQSALDSPLELPASLYLWTVRNASGDDDWVALFKAQYKMPSDVRREVNSKIASKCQGPNSTPCKWADVQRMLDETNRFGSSVGTTPATLNSVETVAARMNGLLNLTKSYQGSGDPQLDILLSVVESKIYEHFATFLKRVGQGNAQVAPILSAKAKESLDSARKSRAQCLSIISSAKLTSPTNRACQSAQLPTLEAALKWPPRSRPSFETADPKNSDLVEMEKKIFVNRKDAKLYGDLSEAYLAKGMLQHASGLAMYASSAFPDDQPQFNGVIGCVAARMGLNAEAKFYLEKAADQRKQECMPR